MPYTATFEIVLPPRDAQQNRWHDLVINGNRTGTVVNIMPYNPARPAPGGPVTGYVHVTDIPDAITMQALRNFFYAAEIDPTNPEPDPETGLYTIVEKRKWQATGRTRIPATVARALIRDREYTTDWLTVKAVAERLYDATTTFSDADVIAEG